MEQLQTLKKLPDAGFMDAVEYNARRSQLIDKNNTNKFCANNTTTVLYFHQILKCRSMLNSRRQSHYFEKTLADNIGHKFTFYCTMDMKGTTS